MYCGKPALLPLAVSTLPIRVIGIPEGPLYFRLDLKEPLGLGKKLIPEISGIPELGTSLETAVAELDRVSLRDIHVETRAGTHASDAEQCVDQKRGTETLLPGGHVLQKIVHMEKGKPVVLEEKVVVDDFPHQAIITAHSRPFRRLHRVEPRVGNGGGQIWLEVWISLPGPVHGVDAVYAVPRGGWQEPLQRVLGPLLALLVRRVGRAAEGVLVDLGIQVRIALLAQEGRHVGKVGKLVTISGLGNQSKLDEHIAMLDMAQNGVGIGAPTNAPEDLLGLFLASGLQHLVDLLEGRLLTLQLIVFALECLGVGFGLVGVVLAGSAAVAAD